MFQPCCRCRMPHLVHRCWTWWKPQPSNSPRQSGSGQVAAVRWNFQRSYSDYLWLSLIYLCNHSHVVNLLRKDKNHSNEMVVAHQRSLVRPLIWYGCHLLRRFFTVCTLWRIPRYPGYISRLHLWLLQNNRVSMPPACPASISSKFVLLWQISKTTLPTVVDAPGSWEAFEQMRNLQPNVARISLIASGSLKFWGLQSWDCRNHRCRHRRLRWLGVSMRFFTQWRYDAGNWHSSVAKAHSSEAQQLCWVRHK